jgi:tetratricopeptide (TPR) repeat protein
MRRFEESVSFSTYTVRLDPLDPHGYLELAYPMMYTGQDEYCEDLLKRCLELNPDFWNCKIILARYYLLKGTNRTYVYDFCKEQLDQFNHDLERMPSIHLGYIGELLAQVAGREEAVEKILHELKSRIDNDTEDTPYQALGSIYSALGETTTAIDFLEKGYEVREPFIFLINYPPTFESLRSSKRFQDLLKKMGFEI